MRLLNIDDDQCAPLLNELASYAADMNRDTLRVLVALADRLTRGRKEYGPMDLATDKRDFKREGAEELMDFCVYEVMDRLREKRA